jgi:hypothetical protein
MLYLFAGDDSKNRISGFEKRIQSLPKGMEIFPVSRNNFDRMQIESLYSGSSLFASSSALVFQNILEQPETRDFVLEKLGKMAESGNHFFFIEGKLGKPILDQFKKIKPKAEIGIFDLPKKSAEKFNSFSVANAFGNKDKLNTWIYFQQAIENDVEVDALAGILFWKVKDMLTKRDFSRFTEDEIKSFAARISYLLPEARTMGHDTIAAFEQFLLEAF